MARYIDRSGQILEGEATPEEMAAQGLREATPDDIATHNRTAEYESKSALGKAGDIAVAGLQGAARGAMAPGMALQKALTGSVPAPGAGREYSALEEGVFEPAALERKERHPFAAAAGEAVPSMVAGGALGAGGAGLAASAAALAGESALSGLSQEAVDAVTEKRDFSASSALWNGVLELAFGGAVFGASRGVGAIRRNWLAEIDGGARVPDPGAGPSPRPMSAGAASEDFTDDVFDEAIKAIDRPGADGNAMDPAARFLAQEADPLYDLAADQIASNIDIAQKVVQQDIGEIVRVADVNMAAAGWTEEMLENQSDYLGRMVPDAEELANVIESAGRAAKATSGQGFDAGGWSSKAVQSLRQGARAVGQKQGGARLMAIVNLKRSLDAVTKGAMRHGDQGSASQLIELVNPFADELRATVRNADLWGDAAPMLGSLDDALHSVIEPLSRFNDKLTERLGDNWAQVGQGKINRRARASAVGGVLRDKAVNNREFFEDIQGAIEGLERLGEARAEYGLSHQGRLPQLQRALAEIKQDLNFSDVLGVARARAERLGGGALGSIVDAGADLVGGRVPVIGGAASRGLKGLASKILNKAELPAPGTPLRRVLDQRLRAYSSNPALGNSGFSYRLPQWLHQEMRGVRARPSGGTPSGGAGSPPQPSGLSPRGEELLRRQRARQGQEGAVVISGTPTRALDKAATRVARLLERSDLRSSKIAALESKAQAAQTRVDELTAKLDSWDHVSAEDVADKQAELDEALAEGMDDSAAVELFDGDGQPYQATQGEWIASLREELADLQRREKQFSDEAYDALEKERDSAYEVVEKSGDRAAALRDSSDGLSDELERILEDADEIQSEIDDIWQAVGDRNPGIPEGGELTDSLLSKKEAQQLKALEARQSFQRELKQIVDRHSTTETFTGLDGKSHDMVNVDGPAAAREWLSKFQRTDTEAGNVELRRRGSNFSPRDVLMSPMGVTSAVGGAALGARALLPEQQQRRDELAQQAQQRPELLAANVQTMEGLARVNQATQQRVSASVARLFSVAGNDQAPPRDAATRRLERTAEALGVTRAVARFLGRATDPQVAYTEKKRALGRIMTDPGALASKMAENLGDLPALHPEIFSRITGHAYRTAAYLQETMPGVSGRSLLDPSGYPPTDDEIYEWAGRWAGALAPLDTIDDLAANDVQPEQLEATKALWPPAFQLFQTTALEHIRLLAARGRDIPQHSLELIDTALELDGAGDPTLSWEMAGTLDAANMAVAQQKQQAAAQNGGSSQTDYREAEGLKSASLATITPEPQ